MAVNRARKVPRVALWEADVRWACLGTGIGDTIITALIEWCRAQSDPEVAFAAAVSVVMLACNETADLDTRRARVRMLFDTRSQAVEQKMVRWVRKRSRQAYSCDACGALFDAAAPAPPGDVECPYCHGAETRRQGDHVQP